MIELLAGPSVCLIDDEEAEYGPMQEALTQMNVGWVHFRGDSVTNLPQVPVKGVRAVFLDLHLNSAAGATRTAHTVSAFIASVAVGDSPILLIVWSKYARDPVTGEVEQEVVDFKAMLKSTLGEAYHHLVILDLVKPYPQRPESSTWVQQLQVQIREKMSQAEGLGALWIWESLARSSASSVSALLTGLAVKMAGQASEQLDANIKELMKLLAQSQGGPDCTRESAPRYLLSTLNQLVQDHLESSELPVVAAGQGIWLSVPLADGEPANVDRAALNARLLTSPPAKHAFAPGTVYEITDPTVFESVTGVTMEHLRTDCCIAKPTQTEKVSQFMADVRPILVELTPSCDFAQSKRRVSVLVAGFAVAERSVQLIKSGPALKTIPQQQKDSVSTLTDRFSAGAQKVALVLHSKYQIVLPENSPPGWLEPLLRFREITAMDIRNWVASQGSRVGYLSV